MKTKILLLTCISLALVGATSTYATGRGSSGGGGRGAGTTMAPNRGATNPSRAPVVNGTGTAQPTPKKDGTGGPGKPANPTGPQDGTSPGPGPKGPRT
ncbi:MAG: hypothetical protein KF715_12260 [Candidatus Didemnitutus sp.]|nr:hypothetical protein [Candidatus Didemnitutus sp.]